MSKKPIDIIITNHEHDGSFAVSFNDNATDLEKFKFIVSLLSDAKKIDTRAEKYDPNATYKIYHNREEYKQALVETLISMGKETFNGININNKELVTKHMGGILSDIAKENGTSVSSYRWLNNLYQSCAKAIGYKTGREKAKEALVGSEKIKKIASKIKKTLRNHQAHDNETVGKTDQKSNQIRGR